jgi:F420H(2)-dependent quinone reductase
MATDTDVAARRHASRPPAVLNDMVLALLRSPLHGVLDPGICELRYRGRRTGRVFALPVIYSEHGDRYVVLIGDSPDKRWWRNFTDPRPVEVRRAGRLRAGTCRVVPPDDPAYEPALRAYVHRQHVSPEPGDRLLLIEFAASPDGR